jgi:DNA-binding response OmpR family regulator
VSTPQPGEPVMQKRPRVLLVEDNDAASRGLSKLLAALGFEVQVVFDGASALEALRTSPPPDFVLTDLRLPDLDGREVALAARQLSPPPRIALITGWDLERDHHNRALWGIDWVFTKPVNVQELVSKLEEGPGAAAPVTPDRSPRPPSGEGGEGTS